MQVKNTKEKLAKKLAKKYNPIFIQEYGSPLDLFSRINLGGWVVETKKPFVYFAVREDEKFYYVWYLIYHYKDWSDWRFPFKSLDEHRHDFQGVMLAVNKFTQDIEWHVARKHYELNPKKAIPGKTKQSFAIEAGSHAIWDQGISFANKGNCIIYHDYILINMLEKKCWRFIQKQVVPAFKTYGVDFPWDWSDWRVQRKFGLRTNGLIWDDPEEFYGLAKKCHII